MSTINSILEEFREYNNSNRDMGDKFERLFAHYLITDPMYKQRFSRVWLWSEWPGRNNKPDTGIDLVAEESATGEFCAIQCKFYDTKYQLQKGDIDSFFTASGKKPFSSRIIISTTDNWSKHAEDALENQHIPVTRLRVRDLADSPIDWSNYNIRRPQDLKLKEKKKLRAHQEKALIQVLEGFQAVDRGKLIMACGTGKTFTSLKIAEQVASNNGTVLFLVPSISLLSQSLREWTAETGVTMSTFAVCSDTKVGKRSENEDISTHDLAFPATTDVRKLVNQVSAFGKKRRMTVIFSTYQSIQVVSDAQKQGLPAFDLIVCDEAHRTTGVTLDGEDESNFIKVHDQKFIKGKRRLYMTATPRIFADSVKTQAEENDAALCSMDDQAIYGKEFHRLSFSEAVGGGLLSDYKVLVLAVDEKYVAKAFQSQIADANNELNLTDAVKITGCWNGLSKRMARGDEKEMENDSAPMRRAVAFCRSIKDSKRITELFAGIVNQYTTGHEDDDSFLNCEVDHVDGTFNALKRNAKLDWLKEDTSEQGNICRILSNARCLSEGVDVPALDAVMFLTPRNSVVDVVQSVGRVMRKAPGKKYGYVILPIGIPADISPEEALKDNDRYRVVWQVLQALRAHDDRFNATVNRIELNDQKPDNIQIIGVGGDNDEDNGDTGPKGKQTSGTTQGAFAFANLDEWRDAIYARIVIKCGDRRYWESWAKDVAHIADRHITRIKALIEDSNPEHRKAFDEFLNGLKSNLNPSIDENDAIEMLSQHLITKPVFDALFEGYEFTKHNPVSISMQKMLDLLEDQALEKETTSLAKFYASVKERASGIDNADGKQRIIVELYDKFFKAAFPKMAEQLGIVYTPIEVVDFIVKSVNDALKQEFGVGVSNPGVHILDPFTGTGTFMVRLLQSGLIGVDDLLYKYKNELHANEIVLLAYYIAAINIEETFYSISRDGYVPFEGIVLTDTFQLSENKGNLVEKMFPENNERATKQNSQDIRVIIGNPPYSAGQNSENDGSQNQKYPLLDDAIRKSYALNSNATNKNSLYDSYIRAFKWASNRIKDKGIICFVSNGSFIDSNVTDGFRKCLLNEFDSIYCFNLRGNQRTSGELSRMEGGKIFGSGSRTPIAITLLIKNSSNVKKGLYYYDIGDYLSREQKLKIIQQYGTYLNINWRQLVPNESGDWINIRDPKFDQFVLISDKTDNGSAIFEAYSPGLQTSRDFWMYNFSRENLTVHLKAMISFYNNQVDSYKKACDGKPKKQWPNVDSFVDNDPKKISWSSSLKSLLQRSIKIQFNKDSFVKAMYRPFSKYWLYYDKKLVHRVGHMPRVFPTKETKNYLICVDGIGSTKEFSALIVDSIPDYEMVSKCKCFALFYFDKLDEELGGNQNLFGQNTPRETSARYNITDETLQLFIETYNLDVTKEDIFYYVYGILHSNEYRERFKANLKKMLPRIPLAQDFVVFSNAGRELSKWHLGYENVDPYPVVETSTNLVFDTKEHFQLKKMIFGKRQGKEDKSTIIYNNKVVLEGIPGEAYNYVVNGKSAIEWVMERYQVSRDKNSQISNDPNNWSDDPKYVVDLIKRVVRVSMETMKIVDSLPPLNELEITIEGFTNFGALESEIIEE